MGHDYLFYSNLFQVVGVYGAHLLVHVSMNAIVPIHIHTESGAKLQKKSEICKQNQKYFYFFILLSDFDLL